VSGEFNASIYVHGSLDGTTYPHEQLNIYSIFEEKNVKDITKPGIYLVENIGYSKFRVRVRTYISGAVSVLARVFVEPIEYTQARKAKPRIECVASLKGYKASANFDGKAINEVDCSDYVYLFVVSRSDTEHNRGIAFGFRFAGHTLGSTYGDVVAIDDSALRSKSERIEPLSEKFDLWLYNRDSVEHTYDIYIYGVR
jgi:hypothetical protein